MKSSLRVFLALVLVVLTGAACSPKKTTSSSASGTSTGTPYKIGFIASVTGGASFLGEPESDVAKLIQARLNEQGGIVDAAGIQHSVEIVILDTEGKGDVAVTLAKKLIDSDQVVAIVGPSTSPSSMALIPVVQEAEVPLLSMASSSSIVYPVAERKWVFKVAQSNEHTSPWQVEYANSLGLTKIANLYVNNAYGEDGAAAIRTSAQESGLEIVLEETFGAADTDMTAQITKIKASDAQAVLVTAIPPAAAILTKQYRELGVDLPLLHNSGVGTQSFIDLSGADNAEGVIFPMGKLVAVDALSDDDPQKAVIQQFLTEYEAFTKHPPSQFAAHAWDSLELVIQALETLPDGLTLPEQRSRVRDAIESTTGYVGVDGIFNFSVNDHVGLSTNDVVLVRISGGTWSYFPRTDW